MFLGWGDTIARDRFEPHLINKKMLQHELDAKSARKKVDAAKAETV